MSQLGSPTREQTDAILARLLRLHPKVIDLSLGRIERLLDRLGRPQDALPPVIHVAGTNGKGSVVASMRAIAEAAGHRVHVYTSPHLVRFNERIRLAGRLIDEDALTTLLKEVEAVNGDDPITFFEITTAAALLAFARHPADLCLLEVGLGGRLDATNVVSRPAACGITPVSLDHQSYLGETLSEIAAEKAGIIRRSVPVVAGPQDIEALEVIAARAAELEAPTAVFGRDWQVELMDEADHDVKLLYRAGDMEMNLPAPVLGGPHQAINAGMAITLLRHQTAIAIPDAAIRAGLGWVRWPGRLQRLESGPLPARLPSDAELWVDGGHNPAAARALKDALSRLAADGRPIHLVLGMQANRRIEEFLRPLAGLIRSVHAITLSGVDAPAPAAEIAAIANTLGLQGLMASRVDTALDSIAARMRGAQGIVLITGSLYLAGEVLAANHMLPD